tara:strand:+ start:1000 stop:1584 length:585 start_codon:yes stop_codon:yes gene_type:complete
MKKNEKSLIIKDHIGIFDNYFTDKISDKYLKYFDTLVNAYSRNDIAFVQDSTFSLMTRHYHSDLNINYIGADFQKVFWDECYPAYVQKYPILKKFNKHKIYDLKLQKTEKGEGYHQWHSEMMDAETRNRFIVISLYLNTIEKGGETEFLDQGLRVEAVKNRFVMFPATYTHVHRGNPPLSGTKYIITGWVEFGE